MSKQSLSWHKECLKNRIQYTSKLKGQFYKAKDEFENALKIIDFYSNQYREAKARGMDSFDRDRFLVKRKKK